MKTSIYSRHRFHLDVEELIVERGVDVSYETVRSWVGKFGSTYAKTDKVSV